MKINDKTLNNIMDTYEQSAHYPKLKLEIYHFIGARLCINNTGICNLEELGELINNLTKFRDAIEKETGIQL